MTGVANLALRFVDRFIPSQVHGRDRRTYRQAQVGVAFAFTLAFWGPVYAGMLAALWGTWQTSAAILLCTALVGGGPFLLRYVPSPSALGNWTSLNLFWLMIYVAWQNGGHGGPSLMWLAAVPVFAVISAGLWSGLFWAVCSVIVVGGFYAATVAGYPFVMELEPGQLMFFDATVLAGNITLMAVLAFVFDVFTRTALDEVAEREARIRAIVQTAADGILILDEHGTVESMNRAAHAIFGITEAETVERAAAELIPSCRPPAQLAPAGMRAHLEPFLGVGHEVEGRRATGDRFPLDLSVTRLGSRERGYVAVVRDITDRKRVERSLEEARDAAVAATKAKSVFLANMSHELRTPLNAIIGYSEMIIEEAEDITVRDAVPDLKRVLGAGRHLMGLINDILDLSKIEAGKIELALEDFDLPHLVRTVVETVRPLAEKNGNLLLVDLGSDLGTMHSDAVRVRQVLFNLLSNASKFTHNGRILLTLRRHRDPAGDRVVITVRDSGVGMSAEQLSRVFQAFVQADQSTSRKYGGTGLGLAITRQVCGLLGGQIDADSAPDQGSTFTVTLPVQYKLRWEGTAVDQPLMEATGSEVGHVLVIDDDPSTRELLGRTLSRHGFRVSLAGDGPTGLKLAQENGANVITLDVIMPGMDGWEVLTRLKQDSKSRNIPVVLVTMVDDRTMGMALGADHYLTKPLDRTELLRVVERYRELRGEHVLVVEDEAQMSELMRRTLERAGFHVEVAENGVEGLERLRLRAPKMILLDLMMPEMNGFDFLTELRRDPDHQHIPVAVVTAMELDAAQRATLQAQVGRVLQKGAYERHELLDEVVRMVHQYAGAGAEA